MARSLVLFQLCENFETTLQHTCNTSSMELSQRPLVIAKPKLCAKQGNLFHPNNRHANFMFEPLSFEPLSIVIATWWSELRFHSSKISKNDTFKFSPV